MQRNLKKNKKIDIFNKRQKGKSKWLNRQQKVYYMHDENIISIKHLETNINKQILTMA